MRNPRLDYEAIVVGGGPAGATAAHELAQAGHATLLVDRPGRIKPCGGAIPPRLLADFSIPPSLLVARVGGATIVSPKGRAVTMAIDGNFVGMVDRDTFDPWLRDRAGSGGAEICAGRVESVRRMADGGYSVEISGPGGERSTHSSRLVIGADGASSKVRRDTFAAAEKPPYVFAYHEIVRSPKAAPGFDPRSCHVYYQGKVSPDFYGWVFPHGETTSVGVGSARKGFDLKAATRLLRRQAGLDDVETVREEGAPLPLRPLKRWDDGHGALLAGDSAGIVAPASGEGIYYAMHGGRLAAQHGAAFLRTGDARMLAGARKAFMRDHRTVFMVLRFMQGFWYRSDMLRECFVAICADKDVQRLTWESYLEKRLVRTDPLAHLRVVFRNIDQLARLAFR